MLPQGSQKKTNTVIVMIDGKAPKTVTTMDLPPEPKKLPKCRLTFILPIMLVVLLSLLAGYCAWLFFSYEAGPAKPFGYDSEMLFYVTDQQAIVLNEQDATTEGTVYINGNTPQMVADNTKYIPTYGKHGDQIDDMVVSTKLGSGPRTGSDFVFVGSSAESVYDSSAHFMSSDDYDYSSNELSSDDYSSESWLDKDALSSSSLWDTPRKVGIDMWRRISNIDKLVNYFKFHIDQPAGSYSFYDPSSAGKGYIQRNDDGGMLDDIVNRLESYVGTESVTPWPVWDSEDRVASGNSEWYSDEISEIRDTSLSSWVESNRYRDYSITSDEEDGSGEAIDSELDSVYDQDSFRIQDWLASVDSYSETNKPPRPVIQPSHVDSVPPQRIEIAVCEWSKKEFEQKATSLTSMKIAIYSTPEYRVTSISTDSASMTHIFKDDNGFTTSTLIYRDYTSSIFGVKKVDAVSSVCYFTNLTPDLGMGLDNDDDSDEDEGSGSSHTNGLRDMTLEIQNPVLLGNNWSWPQLDEMLDASCSTATRYWANTILIKE